MKRDMQLKSNLRISDQKKKQKTQRLPRIRSRRRLSFLRTWSWDFCANLNSRFRIQRNLSLYSCLNHTHMNSSFTKAVALTSWRASPSFLFHSAYATVLRFVIGNTGKARPVCVLNSRTYFEFYMDLLHTYWNGHSESLLKDDYWVFSILIVIVQNRPFEAIAYPSLPYPENRWVQIFNREMTHCKTFQAVQLFRKQKSTCCPIRVRKLDVKTTFVSTQKVTIYQLCKSRRRIDSSFIFENL